MVRKVRTKGNEIIYKNILYPSVSALYRAWSGKKPKQTTFEIKLLKWKLKNPNTPINDDIIERLFTTRQQINSIEFKGKTYAGPKQLYLSYSNKKVKYGTFWLRYKKLKEKSFTKQLSDEEIIACLSPHELFYNDKPYSSFAQLYSDIKGEKITLTRFLANLQRWQKENQNREITDKIIEKCCRFDSGKHIITFNKKTYPTLRALYDAQPSSKCQFQTFRVRFAKLRKIRAVDDNDIELLLKPQVKVGFFKGIMYRWTHIETGKIYIGITSQDLLERTRLHIRQSNSKEKINPLSLQAAIRKYGPKAFKIEKIAEFSNEEDMKNAEKIAVEQHNCLAPNGYNLQEGGISWTKQGTDIEYNGIVYPSYSALAKAHGITEKLLDGRRRLGWSLEQSLSVPAGAKNDTNIPIQFDGKKYENIKSLAKQYNVDPKTLYQRLKLGWTIEEAVELKRRKTDKRKPIIVDGIAFRSISAAAKYYDKDVKIIYAQLQKGLSIDDVFK